MPALPVTHVPETRFGEWFQGTGIWHEYVVERAIRDLFALLPEDQAAGVILDAGCGFGGALSILAQRFGPHHLLALDIDQPSLARAGRIAVPQGTRLSILQADVCRMPIPSASVDLVFCHQTLHHTRDPRAALREMYRILVPGGPLLVAESCRSFLSSWAVRLLFRHPPRHQQTATDYAAMIREAGFECLASNCVADSPWWSRPDAGIAERFFDRPYRGEPTQVRLVARKPR